MSNAQANSAVETHAVASPRQENLLLPHALESLFAASDSTSPAVEPAGELPIDDLSNSLGAAGSAAIFLGLLLRTETT